LVEAHQQPSLPRALWQLLNTFAAYAGLWALMYFSLQVSWWLTVPLAVLAGGILIRVFIIFHDCGHGSFFKSRAANDVLGCVAGLLTFTPYYQWRWEHSVHHATAGNLDRRGIGEIWTLTVQEYLESSRWRRFAYRMARNPVVLFLIAPLFLFLVLQRIPTARGNRRERASVWWMNLAILGMVAGMSALFGVLPYLFLQLIVMGVAGSAGIWLFYVQHQFEDAYWERGEDWTYAEAALRGSSFYRLPRVLQWFSGNIGFHHIHHLDSRIPNYNLPACYAAEPALREAVTLGVRDSFKCTALKLWDERRQRMVTFAEV
jgi:omega-6 fatty acid desaturase (delta-12 desaturase)